MRPLAARTDDGEKATKNALKRQRITLVALLLLVAAIFIGIGGLLHHLESERAQRELSAASAIAEQVLLKELERSDHALASLYDDALRHFRGETSLAELQARLELRNRVLRPHVTQLALLDAQGRIIAADRSELIGQLLAHRDYFVSARAGGDDRLRVLSRPFTSIIDGALETALSRQVSTAREGFRGVVVALIRTTELVADMREHLATASGDQWFAMAHSDGTQMLMEPPRPGQVGRQLNVPGSLFSRHMASGRHGSFFIDTVYATGERSFVDIRTVGLQSVPQQNALVVASTRNQASAYAVWRPVVMALGAAWLVMLAIVLWVLQRERQQVLQRLQREAADAATRQAFEAQLEKQAHTLQTIIDGTRTGTWEWNVQTGETVFNERWAEIIGYTLDELAPVSIATWMRMAHPDDLQLSEQRLTEHFSGDAPYYECEARMRHKNGHWVWVLDRGQVSSWTADSKPLMMTGTHQDITVRKEAELRELALLADQEAMIRSLPVGVYKYRMGAGGVNSFDYVSPLWCRLLGVDEATVLQDPGAAFRAFRPDDMADFLRCNDEAQRTRQPFSWRGRLRDEQGRERWLHIESIASPMENGDVVWHGIIADVTAEELAAQALEESERRFRGFFEKNLSVMLLVEPTTGRVIDANRAAADFYGFCESDLRALTIDQINTLGPAEIAAERQRALREQRNYFNFRHRLASGAVRDVEVYSSPISLHGQMLLFSIVHDISARRQAEEERQQTEMLLRTAIDTIGEAFVVYDADDRLVFCNEDYRRFYASSAPMIEPGRTFEEIIRYGAENGQYLEAIGRVEAWVAERLATHRGPDRELVQPLEDGRWLRIRERRTANGYTVGFRVDVTELYRAKEAAEAASQAKSRFLATMSHEIRTPLNAILGMAQVLMLPGLDERERVDGARTIQESGQMLLSLLNEVLDLARVEAGRMEVNVENCRPGLVVDQVSHLFGELARAKSLELLTEDTTPPERIYLLDATRVRQMLSNLVANAIKFTPAGKITVHLGEMQEMGGEVLLEFAVSDTGIGIPQERIAELFQPFAQLDSSPTRQFEGSGLGLYTVRTMARLMGGEAGVSSQEGKGSRFWFTVRAAIVEPAEAPAAVVTGADDAVAVLSDPGGCVAALLPMLRRHEFQALARFRTFRAALGEGGAAGAALREIGGLLDGLRFAEAASRLEALAIEQAWRVNSEQ